MMFKLAAAVFLFIGIFLLLFLFIYLFLRDGGWCCCYLILFLQILFREYTSPTVCQISLDSGQVRPFVGLDLDLNCV